MRQHPLIEEPRDPEHPGLGCVLIDDPRHPGEKICRMIRDPAALESEQEGEQDTFDTSCECYLHCECNRDNFLTLVALNQQVYQLCGDKAL